MRDGLLTAVVDGVKPGLTIKHEAKVKNRLILFLFTTLALAACETVKGAGRDIGTAGDAISSTANKVQSQL
ncbi:entericidin A/B family lipoprotein [Albidovulum litorale]|uniref:entericidin A/B family lipoprotein n=1 Tax=Albidovulum litorale TaxID=2984134 RepID=UPI002980E130|nr:entericidin A/B family lipoprotein [Defluviimonas sp. WL0050]